MAEAHRNRTYQSARSGLNGFEDRATHQSRSASICKRDTTTILTALASLGIKLLCETALGQFDFRRAVAYGANDFGGHMAIN